ncbi:unnamed protein product [Dovyalis caffra]|uniref:Uncharacterized protein n=1 Tax=Dovyalis caffra TaxID=77055 RepID=A0AAV1QSD8_9ROSI|nr:unnamed protein product [Dovyalis caffra]
MANRLVPPGPAPPRFEWGTSVVRSRWSFTPLRRSRRPGGPLGLLPVIVVYRAPQATTHPQPRHPPLLTRQPTVMPFRHSSTTIALRRHHPPTTSH